jgi:hypothetical protein
MVYVPLKTSGKLLFLVIAPVRVTTCPFTEAEVIEILPAVRVPVRVMVDCRSKHLHPSAWNAAVTALSV